MPDTRPQIDEAAALGFLQKHFSDPVTDLQRIESGQISRTFSFRAGGQDYILRFNNDDMLINLDKEAYIFEHFASPHLPIPRIVQVGRYGELHFAISHRVPGVILSNLPRAEYEVIIPQLIETVDSMRTADLGSKPGFGIFDALGRGAFPGWRAYVTLLKEEGDPRDYYGHWHALFDSTFLERDLWFSIYDRMVRLLDYCPHEPYLVHGNVSVSNVLVHEGQITGVIDWINAMYGDFLYDVACLAFWCPGDDYEGRFREYYASKRVEVPSYEERLLCYECYMGLDALRFFAKTGKEPEYIWTRDRLLSLLG